MQLRDIQYVIAVAEAHGFSKAAEQIHVSQPALSQLIRRLEDELGVRLFSREKNKVSLTYAGEAFLEDGRTIVELSERLKRKMADFREQQEGQLTVSASPFYQRCCLARVLPAFQRRHPRIRVSVVEAFSQDQEQMLLRGRVDLIVVPYSRPIPRIRFEKLFVDEIALAVPRDSPVSRMLRGKRETGLTSEDLSLLSGEDFVMYREGRRIRERALDLCREAGFEPRIVLETNSCESISTLVMRGMGIGFVPMATRLCCLPEEQPLLYRILNPLAHRDIVIGYKENRLASAGMEFIRIALNSLEAVDREIRVQSR